jgi:hypothetical protein
MRKFSQKLRLPFFGFVKKERQWIVDEIEDSKEKLYI